jgi:hypothetical protein
MKNFFWLLSLFTIVITVIIFIISARYEGLVYDHILYFIIYYYIVSFVSNSLINFAIAKKKGNFTIYYLGSMVARFLLSILMVFLFMILDKTNVVVIGINFVILHLLFLGLDLFIIITKVKGFSSKDQDLNVGQSTK